MRISEKFNQYIYCLTTICAAMPRKIILIYFIVYLVFTLVVTSGCISPGSSVPVSPNQVSQSQTSSEQVTIANSQNDFSKMTPVLSPVTLSTADVQQGVTTSSPEIVVQSRGIEDPAFVVDIMIPEKISPGTTLVGDLHDLTRPRIVEVNKWGEIMWKYDIPTELKDYTNPGFSVVPLQNGNILAAFPRKGVYEINRTTKAVVWKFTDFKASHDAERLGNGNTLVVDGGYGHDTMADAQVIEINPQGQIVWSWYAKEEFNRVPYNSITDNGWTHTNAASRMENGDTLISLRNFNLVAEVDSNGKIVRTIGEGIMSQQHDPEMLPNGNILFANPGRPPQAVEINPAGSVVWNYTILPDTPFSSASTRDADRLQNGNTLITVANRLIEVTPQGIIVWQFRLKDIQFVDADDAKSRGFYKAIRIPS